MTLETINDGVIYVGGEPLWHEYRGDRPYPPAKLTYRRMRKEWVWCFQQFSLFPHMTVRRNIAEAPVRDWACQGKSQRRAEKYLDLVGLSDQADKFPSQLSGGQQQRVAIARALAMHPNIMLLTSPPLPLTPNWWVKS